MVQQHPMTGLQALFTVGNKMRCVWAAADAVMASLLACPCCILGGNAQLRRPRFYTASEVHNESWITLQRNEV